MKTHLRSLRSKNYFMNQPSEHQPGRDRTTFQSRFLIPMSPDIHRLRHTSYHARARRGGEILKCVTAVAAVAVWSGDEFDIKVRIHLCHPKRSVGIGGILFSPLFLKPVRQFRGCCDLRRGAANATAIARQMPDQTHEVERPNARGGLIRWRHGRGRSLVVRGRERGRYLKEWHNCKRCLEMNLCVDLTFHLPPKHPIHEA